MKLQKFKEKDHKKLGICIFTIFCIFLIALAFFFRSFALFTDTRELNLINGNVSLSGDLYFAYYIDGKISNTIPDANSDYILSSSSFCTNGVTVSWNRSKWTARVNYKNYNKETLSKTKCTLYFVQNSDPTTISNVTNYIKKLAETSSEIVDDGTNDHNLRYVGANPNNYVQFNGVLWRIIGVMNNIDDGNGKKSSRVKIVRNESIGNFLWDTSPSTVNGGYGINEWSGADLMKLLNPGFEANADYSQVNSIITVNNSLYWSKKSGTCYASSGNNSEACDLINVGLNEAAKLMISNAVWNLGAIYLESTVDKMYELERGNVTGKGCTSSENCNDTIERKNNWTGIVGLPYPSDYGYATAKSVSESCKTLKLNAYTSTCTENNWLYKSFFTSLYFMSPISGEKSNNAYSVSYMSNGKVLSTVASTKQGVFPTVYLTNNVDIINGEGTSSNPYILSAN